MYFFAFGAVKPAFTATNVTVAVAFMAVGNGTARSQSRPDGMSTATMGRDAALIASMSSMYGMRSWPWSPVPNIASTTRSDLAVISSIREAILPSCMSITFMGMGIFSIILRFMRASPATFSFWPHIMTRGLTCAFAKWRAMT